MKFLFTTSSSGRFFFYAVLIIVFVLSFRLYSSLFYPALNSDNAVTVLMIHHFKLPQDLYFWGQDRMGSLIPLLGQVPYKFPGMSALAAEASVHYLVLLLGYLAFASFLNSRFLKIIFAVIWFLPPMRLIDVTQFGFGLQYSLLAMACWLIRFRDNHPLMNIYKNHLTIFLIVLLLIGAVWVNDMAIVSVLILIGFLFFRLIRNDEFSWKNLLSVEMIYSMGGIMLGFLFIRYAKEIAGSKNEYAAVAGVETIISSVKIFLKTIKDLLLFRAREPVTGIYGWLLILIIPLLTISMKGFFKKGSQRMWAVFFLSEAVVLFIIIMISQWTADNNVPRRYFTCTYISLSFAILLILDQGKMGPKTMQVTRVLLVMIVATGAFSTYYNLKYIWPKTMKPQAEWSDEFSQLGKAGLIGDYWNSYILSCTCPDKIFATPHDQTWAVRSQELVNLALSEKDIYIVRDGWMDHYPDTLMQFGKQLIREGEEFRLGNCYLCKYYILQVRE